MLLTWLGLRKWLKTNEVVLLQKCAVARRVIIVFKKSNVVKACFFKMTGKGMKWCHFEIP